MKTRTPYAEATTAAHSSEPEEIQGFLHVRKVVTEHVPIVRREGGHSTGEMIDIYLRDCALEGQEIQELTLEFSQESWKRLVQETHEKRGGS